MKRRWLAWIVAVVCLYAYFLSACGCDSDDDDNNTDDDTDDDADDDTDDDTAPIPGDAGLDESPGWCPGGYGTERGGCIERMSGGAPGRDGVEIAMWADGAAYIAATRGREIVLYALDSESTVLREWVLTRMGAHPDFVFDENGSFHIVYEQLERETVEYLVFENGVWRRETVAEVPGIAEWWWAGSSSAPSIAVGGDAVHIAYWNGADLIYARRDAEGVWSSETVLADEAWFHNDIAHGPDGDIHIAASTVDDGGFVYATRHDGEWFLETATETSGPVSLVVDASGAASLCWIRAYEYEGETYRIALFATDENGAWENWEVDDSSASNGCDLWAGDDEYVEVLASSDYPDGTFVFDSRNDFTHGWYSTQVDEKPAEGAGPAFAHRDSGDSSAAFHRERALMAARQDGENWSLAPIDEGVGVNVSADRGPNGELYLAAVSEPDQLELFTFAADGGREVEDLSSLMDGEYNAVSLAARDECLVIYVSSTVYLSQTTFRYLVRRDGEWSAFSYDWGKGHIGGSSMMVGDDCAIHFVANNHDYKIFHASDETDTWVITRIDWVNQGQAVVGALDRNGDPYVVYGLFDTRHARRVNNTWETALFDDEGFEDGLILFDEDNTEWIVARTDFYGDIGVFKSNDPGWEESILPAEGLATYAAAFAPDGSLHVVKTEFHNRGVLSDNVLSDGAWLPSEDIDLVAGTRSVSLLFDDNGQRHAFYTANGDIVYQAIDAAE